MIIVDSSALAKLLVSADQSAALRQALLQQSSLGDEFAISTMAVTELRRLTIRLAVTPDRIVPIVSRFHIIRLSESVLQIAARLPARHLGTLDAIHLATALAVEASTVITYHRRQAEAAQAEGIATLSPGGLDPV
ncbi:MAG: type II toxin-antitoxin system VapC family toxin [Propioniciclava sp.]